MWQLWEGLYLILEQAAIHVRHHNFRTGVSTLHPCHEFEDVYCWPCHCRSGIEFFGTGSITVLRHCFPLAKQPMVTSSVMVFSSLGLVSAPMIGGALIDAFSWRACFGINLPLGVLCIFFTWYGFSDPVSNPDNNLPWKEKVKRLDPLGTLLVVPAITCFLMALQWGGIKYGWNNWRIILLFVLFGILFSAFGYAQYRRGDAATLPMRIVKQRSILAALWFSSCCNGILAVTESYIAIYFQGVKGLSATSSGLLGLPMIAGLGLASLASGMGINAIGYYFRKLCHLLQVAVPPTYRFPSLHVRHKHFGTHCIWHTDNHQS